MSTIKSFCHECGKATNQEVLSQVVRGNESKEEYQWGENHYFCRCQGCDALSYAISRWTEDDWDPSTGESECSWETYPRGVAERRPMSEQHLLPGNVWRIYKEAVGAMNAQLPLLAGIGLRALIEAVCQAEGVTGGDLKERIDGLATKGVLSVAQADILHTHRFLGNVAAHEIVAAPPRELVAAMEIAENVLRTIYILPELSKQVKTGRKP